MGFACVAYCAFCQNEGELESANSCFLLWSLICWIAFVLYRQAQQN